MASNEHLRVRFGEPARGWLAVSLSGDGRELEFVASAVPADSLSDLADALLVAASGAPAAVAWHEEPGAIIFGFRMDKGKLAFAAWREPSFSGGRESAGGAEQTPLFAAQAPPAAILRPFWKALRDLQAASAQEEHQASWGHRFPERAVARLGDWLAGGR
ncbi:MAG TPA: hypothetical protein VGE07_14295 [Herpetosiphonaceae bacterium]